jgi:mRNA-degrading endonuclease RelE of RelBE toxin-antitoxin system
MQIYKIRIHKKALHDIQEASNWYNRQLPGLGKRFQNQVKKQINSLKTTATHHSIRYSDVRCNLVKKFPFLIHYVVNESEVEVFAVIHTSRNPEIWKISKNS